MADDIGAFAALGNALVPPFCFSWRLLGNGGLIASEGTHPTAIRPAQEEEQYYTKVERETLHQVNVPQRCPVHEAGRAGVTSRRRRRPCPRRRLTNGTNPRLYTFSSPQAS